MCGVLAVINAGEITLDQVQTASNLMLHRGPDNNSVKFYPRNSLLAHNRLSIIDLNERSHQPFSIENYHLIYNGEVYNYKELIKSMIYLYLPVI